MKLPSNTQFLLFDMDGTLIDTEPVGPRNFIEQLKRHHQSPTPEECQLFTKIWRRDGTDIKQDDWLSEISHKYEIQLSPDAYLKEFYDMYVQAIIAAPTLPGVETFLKQARAVNRYKLALVTASKRTQVEAVIKQHEWQNIFDAIVTSEDVTRFKPDPESFVVGMCKLQATADMSVVFEDSKNGAKAGQAAGCYVIGLRAGNSKPQDLTSANIIVDSFSDVSLD